MKTILILFVSVFLLGPTAQAMELVSGSYLVEECQTEETQGRKVLYLPAENPSPSRDIEDVSVDIPVALEFDPAQRELKATYTKRYTDSEQNISIDIRRKSFSNSYRAKLVDRGQAFDFSGKKRTWTFSQLDSETLKIEYKSIVRFLSLPTRTAVSCILKRQ